MAKKKNDSIHIKLGILTGLGVVVYIMLVGLLIIGLSNSLAKAGSDILQIMVMLILLVVSASITGGLVLGYPAFLFINKKYKEAIYMAASSVVTIFVFGLISILFVLLLA